MKTGRFGTVVVLALAAGFYGCGGGGDDPSPTVHNDPVTTNITVGGSVRAVAGGGAEGFFFVQNQDGDPVEVFNTDIRIEESANGTNWQQVAFNFDNGRAANGSRLKSFAISAAITMDYSGSMNNDAITNMEAAVSTFVNLMASSDKAEIIKFSSDVWVAQDFTTDRTELLAAVTEPFAGAGNSTALYDSMLRGVNDTAGQRSPWAVLALTDGGENASSASQADVISAAQSSGIPIFTLGLGSYIRTNELITVAESTGGFYYQAPAASDLREIYERISGVLSQSVRCTWTPSAASGTVQCRVTITYQTTTGTYTVERIFTYTL